MKALSGPCLEVLTMATKINWCDETLNPQGWGCWGPGGTPDNPRVCPGCYAERISHGPYGKCPECREFKPHWHPERLEQPCKWQSPRSIFWQDMGDLWHPYTPAWQIRAVLNAAEATPRHTHLFLTKNPMQYLNYIKQLKKINCFCGVTIRKQSEIKGKMHTITTLSSFGIKVFISYEPALGPVDLSSFIVSRTNLNVAGPDDVIELKKPIHGVIMGGMTGAGADPMHPYWALKVRDDCAVSGIPFMFKQWGEWLHQSQFPNGASFKKLPNGNYAVCELVVKGGLTSKNQQVHEWPDETISVHIGRAKAGRLLDGRTHDALPWTVK